MMNIGDRSVLWFQENPQLGGRFQVDFRREGRPTVLILIDERSQQPERSNESWVVEVVDIDASDHLVVYKVKLIELVPVDIIFELGQHPRTKDDIWTRELDVTDDIIVKYVLCPEDIRRFNGMSPRQIKGKRWDCKVKMLLYEDQSNGFFVVSVGIIDTAKGESRRAAA